MSRLLVRRKRNRKDIGSHRRGRLRLLLILIILGLVVFFLTNGILRAVSVTNYISKPLTPLLSEALKLSGSEKVVVAIVSEPVFVLSFDQKEKSLTILEIPQDVFANVLPGFGFYPLSSAFGLGQLENPPQGGKIFLSTLSSALSGPVDFYIQVKGEEKISLGKDQVLALQKNLTSPGAILLGFKSLNWIPENLETNLTLFDMYRLWWKASQIRSTKIAYYQLQEDTLEDLVLPDGKIAKMISEAGINEFSKVLFQDQEILSEKLSVEILNASQKSGLSGKIGEIIDSSGMDVSFVGNAQALAKTSSLVVDTNVKNSRTVRKLSRFFGIMPKEKKEKTLFDVSLILGEDLAQIF